MESPVSSCLPGWPACRVGELILHDVLSEIAAYRERQIGDPPSTWLDLPRLREKLALGTVRFGARDLPPPEIDADLAIRAALEALHDGIVLMFVDGVRRTDPDEVLALTPESRVRYIKLTALRGF